MITMQAQGLQPAAPPENQDFPALASNAALWTLMPQQMSSPTPPPIKLSGRPDKGYRARLINSNIPLQGVKLSSISNDIRSRTRRVLRISSRPRVYHDHRQLSTSPVSSIPSPSLKNVTLPPFPPPISTSLSETKLRARGRWPRWPLPHGLNESPTFWLALYFLLNLSLTLYNKSVLVNFPFPYTLTAFHALCSAAGSAVLIRSNASLQDTRRFSSLNWKEVVTLILFSTLFTINIATSNISLGLVTIPVCSILTCRQIWHDSGSQFHQVVRATTPLFTMLLSQILLGTCSSRDKLASLVPIITGVVFA